MCILMLKTLLNVLLHCGQTALTSPCPCLAFEAAAAAFALSASTETGWFVALCSSAT